MTFDPIPVEFVNAKNLASMLEEAGWSKVGGRKGLYSRYAYVENSGVLHRAEGATERDPLTNPAPRRSILVPLDASAPEYRELLLDALETLRRLPSPSTGDTWLNRLTTSPTDQFSFAKETGGPRGWIQWGDGESLILAARGLLIAGAKSAREQISYFGNKYGQFANRFLDEVMMGQTAVGSYIVRAYVPTSSAIPLKGSKEALNGMHFSGVDAIDTRAVSESVAHTLEGTVEALDHYRRSSSLSAFIAPELGLSYEGVSAVKALATNAETSNVRVSWSGGRATGTSESEYTFFASHVPVLERAANTLVAVEPQREIVATGVTHLLSRHEAEGPGVVGLSTLSGSPAKKIRVHLSSDDYHRALAAHDQNMAITVTGNLEREGTLSHLYAARITDVTPTEGSESTESGDPSGTHGEGELPL